MGYNNQHSGHTGKKNQNELMVIEIYSKGLLVKDIGKVLRIKFS